MKALKLTLSSDFKLELEEHDALFELENNSAKIEIEAELDDTLGYELHIQRGEDKALLLLNRDETGLYAYLTNAILNQPGRFQLQLRGIKDDYAIESNKVYAYVREFINATYEPTPEEEGEIEKLFVRVSEVESHAIALDHSVATLNEKVDTEITNLTTSLQEEVAERKETDADQDEMIAQLVDGLSNKADNDKVETLQSQLGEFADDLQLEVEARQQADARLDADIEAIDKSKANISDVYTKEQSNVLLNNKADVGTVSALNTTLRSEIAKKQDKLIAGTHIIIENNVISTDGTGGVSKEYVEEHYYDKLFINNLDNTLTQKIDAKADISDVTNKTSYAAIAERLYNNTVNLTDEQKLKIETWLGLSENYLTNYNSTPYSVNGDYVPAHKKYVDEQDTKIMDKVSELELFKFPNVTIVGEPTINHGQVSDFSSTSYLKFPFLVDFHNQAFEINMCFTTSTNVVNQENIFDSDFGLAFAIRNGKFVIAISTNGTSWDLGEGVGTYAVQPNTTYYVKLYWNKLQYKLDYSLDNKTFITDITKTAATQPYPRQIYIGVGENFTTIMNHFSGTINLNNANLKIANDVVWAGMDDAGLSTRADVSLSNIDFDGEQRVKTLAKAELISGEELTVAEQQAIQRRLGILSSEGVKF